jgi:hypothetical protein
MKVGGHVKLFKDQLLRVPFQILEGEYRAQSGEEEIAA